MKETNNYNYEYIIRNTINELIEKRISGKKIAICGAGEHTAQLIKYFGDRLNIVLITGREILSDYHFDFPFCKESDLQNNEFDCVLLSSFKYRGQMLLDLKRYCINKDIIDIYSLLENKGIKLEKDFYKYFSRIWIKT